MTWVVPGVLVYADGGGDYPINCDDICNNSLGGCSPLSAGEVTCFQDCTGRRPAGLVPCLALHGDPLAAHFTVMARLESASVHSFRHLGRELSAHRAPSRLVRSAKRAAREEVRHARAAGALARRHGGRPNPPEVESGPIRDLETIATENATEGCVREAFGALVACWQAKAAADPVVRATMKRIAGDETRHAALALQIDGWLSGRLLPTARARVDQARRAALADLAASVAEAPAALRRPLGLPTASQSHFLQQQIAALA
jgi:hypothetical protein